MNRESLQSARELIHELEMRLESGFDEDGKELTEDERHSLRVQISNIWYDIEND